MLGDVVAMAVSGSCMVGGEDDHPFLIDVIRSCEDCIHDFTQPDVGLIHSGDILRIRAVEPAAMSARVHKV